MINVWLSFSTIVVRGEVFGCSSPVIPSCFNPYNKNSFKVPGLGPKTSQLAGLAMGFSAFPVDTHVVTQYEKLWKLGYFGGCADPSFYKV